jgi:L-glyceraldehyde 3-phosphate reductase
LGVTHFDLANNYGPPYGSAEENFGRMLANDPAALRDELDHRDQGRLRHVAGPYGEWGSRKYLTASLDQSLRGMGLDYVDIFYSHRLDPETPLEETMGALDARCAPAKRSTPGISSTRRPKTREAPAILQQLGHAAARSTQPSYSMINRWLERDQLLDTLDEVGAGLHRFLAAWRRDCSPTVISRGTRGFAHRAPEARYSESHPDRLQHGEGARPQRDRRRRGQSLAQLALAWALRDPG